MGKKLLLALAGAPVALLVLALTAWVGLRLVASFAGFNTPNAEVKTEEETSRPEGLPEGASRKECALYLANLDGEQPASGAGYEVAIYGVLELLSRLVGDSDVEIANSTVSSVSQLKGFGRDYTNREFLATVLAMLTEYPQRDAPTSSFNGAASLIVLLMKAEIEIEAEELSKL